MLRLFRSRRRPARRPTRHRRIGFESLERRYCLSAPSITAFDVDSVDETTVSVSGYVSDESPETAEVTFTGALSGSATPNSNGYFSYSGTGSYLGTITAVAEDDEQLESDPAYADIESDVPTFDGLSVTYGYHTAVTISGRVVDEDPAGLTVTLSGVVNGSTTTDSNGNFSFYQAETGTGNVHVSVVDPWGQQGSDDILVEGNNPPTISNFDSDVDHWILVVSGTVNDEDPEDIPVKITFYGQTYTVYADSNGDFSWSKEMAIGEGGILTCFATDWWLNASNVESVYIPYRPYY